jgi:hypothetical protein
MPYRTYGSQQPHGETGTEQSQNDGRIHATDGGYSLFWIYKKQELRFWVLSYCLRVLGRI